METEDSLEEELLSDEEELLSDEEDEESEEVEVSLDCEAESLEPWLVEESLLEVPFPQDPKTIENEERSKVVNATSFLFIMLPLG